MNNERRKVINNMIAKLEEVQSELESCADWEQEAYDTRKVWHTKRKTAHNGRLQGVRYRGLPPLLKHA